jgi:putative transposase
MAHYRRNFLPGGSYFFMVNLADRRRALLTDHIDLLRAVFCQVRARHPFATEAAVILPDHLHAIWILPDGDADFATRWRLIKSGFSIALPGGERISASRRCQRRARDLAAAVLGDSLCDEDDFRAAPRLHSPQSGEARPRSPRAGLAIFSFRRWVRFGADPADWAVDPAHVAGAFGEQ